MKIVRTLIVETGPNVNSVRAKISASGWAEESRLVDENRILAKISDTSKPGLLQKERSIRNIEGVKSCSILTTQYMS
jgi:hypothetical protein